VWRVGAAVVSGGAPEHHLMAVRRRGIGRPHLIASWVSRSSLQLEQLGRNNTVIPPPESGRRTECLSSFPFAASF